MERVVKVSHFLQENDERFHPMMFLTCKQLHTSMIRIISYNIELLLLSNIFFLQKQLLAIIKMKDNNFVLTFGEKDKWETNAATASLTPSEGSTVKCMLQTELLWSNVNPEEK